jgi:predicted site-specific integrase-resolvase
MKTYSTKQVAKVIGIHWVTLRRWLANRRIRPSQGIRLNGSTLWRWTDRDVERVRKYKEANYRKGRGRKPKPKR